MGIMPCYVMISNLPQSAQYLSQPKVRSFSQTMCSFSQTMFSFPQVTLQQNNLSLKNKDNQISSTEPLFYDPNNEIVNIDGLAVGGGGKTGSQSRPRTTTRTCLASEPMSTKTLRGGTEAGVYTRHGQVARFEDCVEFCCGNRSCDIAMTLNNECYSVACFNRYTCEVIESEANKDVKTLVSLVHQGPTKLTKRTTDTTETANGKKSEDKDNQLFVCQHTDINYGMTVRGGFHAGKFTEHGILPDVDTCVERCCESLSCDVALVIADSCFTLKCDNKETCDMVPAQNAEYLQPKLVYLKTRIKTLDSVNNGVNGTGSSDITSDNRSLNTTTGSSGDIGDVVPVTNRTQNNVISNENAIGGADKVSNQIVNTTEHGKPKGLLKKLDDASIIQPQQNQNTEKQIYGKEGKSLATSADHVKVKDRYIQSDYIKGKNISQSEDTVSRQSMILGNHTNGTQRQDNETVSTEGYDGTISNTDLQNANKTLKDLQRMLFMVSGNNTGIAKIANEPSGTSEEKQEQQQPNESATRKDLPFSNNFHHKDTNRETTPQNISSNNKTLEMDHQNENTTNEANNTTSSIKTEVLTSNNTAEDLSKNKNNTAADTDTSTVQSSKEAKLNKTNDAEDNKPIAKDKKYNETTIAQGSKPNADVVVKDNSKTNKTECTPYQIFTNQTLHGGSKAGVFQHQQDITDFDSCVQRCCFFDDCDVALMMADELCFIVTCHSRDACDVEDPVETKGKIPINSKIAYVRIALLEIGMNIFKNLNIL